MKGSLCFHVSLILAVALAVHVGEDVNVKPDKLTPDERGQDLDAIDKEIIQALKKKDVKKKKKQTYKLFDNPEEDMVEKCGAVMMTIGQSKSAQKADAMKLALSVVMLGGGAAGAGAAAEGAAELAEAGKAATEIGGQMTQAIGAPTAGTIAKVEITKAGGGSASVPMTYDNDGNPEPSAVKDALAQTSKYAGYVGMGCLTLVVGAFAVAAAPVTGGGSLAAGAAAAASMAGTVSAVSVGAGAVGAGALVTKMGLDQNDIMKLANWFKDNCDETITSQLEKKKAEQSLIEHEEEEPM